MKSLLLTLSLLIGSSAYACDPTESPNCNDGPDLSGAATFGMITAGSIGVAGIVTAIGGGANLRSKGWRQANYVIGSLTLVEALILGSIGAAIYTPESPTGGQIFLGCAAGALAVGALDVGLAIGSAVKSSRPAPRMTVVPLASRDSGGFSLVGRF
jgi:hypothetical protein